MKWSEVKMYPAAPYDMSWTARFFGRFKKDVVDIWQPPDSVGSASYSRLFTIDGQPTLVKVHQEGAPDNPCLIVRTNSGSRNDQVSAVIEKMLRVHDGLDDFYRAAEYDSVMSRLKRCLYGLKPTITPSVFEAIIIAISEQQISLEAAVTLRSRLAQRFGMPLRWNGHTYYSFPDATSLAAASANDICSLAFSRKRAESIKRVAQMQATGEFDFESLRLLCLQEALGRLMLIRGIGKWSAQYVLARGLGHLDVYPETDLGVRRAVSYFYGNGDFLSFREANNVLSKWGSLSRLAEYYLLVGYALEKARVKRNTSAAQPNLAESR